MSIKYQSFLESETSVFIFFPNIVCIKSHKYLLEHLYVLPQILRQGGEQTYAHRLGVPVLRASRPEALKTGFPTPFSVSPLTTLFSRQIQELALMQIYSMEE